MPGLYSITNRVGGELITAAKYNADHQVHVDNQTPQMTDDYSSNTGQMQAQTDPGESGSENPASSLAGELERIRFAIAEMKGTTYWYQSGGSDTSLLMWGVLS